MIELTLGENGIEGIIYGHMGKITSRTTYASEDNIPADIRSKLSILKLLQDANEIPSVGQRVSDTIYWIFDDLEGDLIFSKMVYAEAILNQIPIHEAYKKLEKPRRRRIYE
jgi:hypothetical protein